MDLVETSTYSFVVRVWREEVGDEPGHGVWRGHITHVESGERRYVRSLGGVAAFIAPYLARLGLNPGFFWRARIWLGRLARRRPYGGGSE